MVRRDSTWKEAWLHQHAMDVGPVWARSLSRHSLLRALSTSETRVCNLEIKLGLSVTKLAEHVDRERIAKKTARHLKKLCTKLANADEQRRLAVLSRDMNSAGYCWQRQPNEQPAARCGDLTAGQPGRIESCYDKRM